MDAWNFRGGQLRFLTDEQVYRLHLATLKVLDQTGHVFKDQQALKVFEEAGADVDYQRHLVRIPASMVEEAIRQAPSRITLAARNPKYDLEIEEDRVYFGTGSLANHVLDLDSEQRRPSTKEDVYDFARLVDALEYVHVYKVAVFPNDVPDPVVERHMVEASFNGTEKHFSPTVFSAEGVKDVVRMAEIVAGGSKELRRRPLLSINPLAVSPLQWDARNCQIIMEVARQGIPMIVDTEPMSGSTAPVTLAGTSVIQNAEILAGITLAQLVNPGTPVLCASVASIMDMKTGQYASGAVELGILIAVQTQMARYYKLPMYGSGGMSDAKLPDIQAGYEKGLQILVTALAGCNYIHDAAGLLENCLSMSYEQTVIDDEICGMVGRVLNGVSFDEDRLALDLIARLGPGGIFLGERHTLKYLREEHFIPDISDRRTREAWESRGSKRTAEVAKEKARKILEEHFPTPLPDDIKKELSNVVKKAEEKI